MKKLTIFCALMLLLSYLFSCSKIDDTPDNKTLEELIVGQWQLEKIYDLDGNDASDECTPQNKMSFLGDRTMEWYSYSMHAGDCAEDFYHLKNKVTYKTEGASLIIHLESLDGSSENELVYPAFSVSETELIIKLTDEHKGAIYKRIP